VSESVAERNSGSRSARPSLERPLIAVGNEALVDLQFHECLRHHPHALNVSRSGSASALHSNSASTMLRVLGHRLVPNTSYENHRWPFRSRQAPNPGTWVDSTPRARKPRVV
jgi:hypothetical protein